MYHSLGEYNQAKELLEKALIIRKKIFGEDHADVATSYNKLALVYDNRGEYTVKAYNFTKKHWLFTKRFLVKIMPL